jgi:hypothetical protein
MLDLIAGVCWQTTDSEPVPVFISKGMRPSPPGRTIWPVADHIEIPDGDGDTYEDSMSELPTVVIVDPESTNRA